MLRPRGRRPGPLLWGVAAPVVAPLARPAMATGRPLRRDRSPPGTQPTGPSSRMATARWRVAEQDLVALTRARPPRDLQTRTHGEAPPPRSVVPTGKGAPPCRALRWARGWDSVRAKKMARRAAGPPAAERKMRWTPPRPRSLSTSPARRVRQPDDVHRHAKGLAADGRLRALRVGGVRRWAGQCGGRLVGHITRGTAPTTLGRAARRRTNWRPRRVVGRGGGPGEPGVPQRGGVVVGATVVGSAPVAAHQASHREESLA
ncbi:hypothetical protein F610DRAFT_00721 [Streptomyces sp. LaPpAH-199]|nr:hypothetical protein F610DRAFT_00721 [Streptomyces sp. LaPpAH-199]